MNHVKATILVVEDEQYIARVLETLLTADGYRDLLPIHINAHYRGGDQAPSAGDQQGMPGDQFDKNTAQTPQNGANRHHEHGFLAGAHIGFHGNPILSENAFSIAQAGWFRKGGRGVEASGNIGKRY